MPIPFPSTLTASCALLLAAALAGCASAPPAAEQCTPTDWAQAGLEDGQDGFPARDLTELVANCAKAGVTLDTSAYLPGWQKGIDLFCTPQNGWRQGAQGQHQKLERCAGQPQDAAFRQQLQAGLEMAKLLEQRSSNAGMLQKLNRQMRSSRNPAERRSLQEQMDALDKVQAQLRRQMSALEANAPR